MKKYIIWSALVLALSFSAVSAQTYTFNTNLTVGSSGTDVSNLQTVLISMGFDIPAISSGVTAKGYFGLQTKAAVVRYQASVGLPNTGYVGPLTRGKLNGDRGGNRAPVINSIDAPSTLTTNQAGTWMVRASDPENDQLSYSVDWGDVYYAVGCDPLPVGYNGGPCTQPGSGATQSSFVQNATFTHSYTLAGTYTVNFTVRDSAGNQTRSSITVQVSNNPAPSVTVLTPNGGESWIINSNKPITWKINNTSNPNQKVDIYLGRQQYPPGACGDIQPCGPFFEQSSYVLDKDINSNQGPYYWIVGTDIVNNPIPSGNYGVRICLAGTQNCDFSNAPFFLVNQPI